MTQVPLALYAMRLAPHSATGVSPFLYVFGRTMTSPIDLLYRNIVGNTICQSGWNIWRIA